MNSGRNSIFGPTAPWVDDDTVYPLVLRRTADTLADRLSLRAAKLREDPVDIDTVILEIRKQIAACALDDPIRASDLAEMLMELLLCRENAHRDI